MSDLTKAEQAAAEALRANPYGCHLNDEVCDECACTFRAVVEAVRPIIAADTLNQAADILSSHGFLDAAMIISAGVSRGQRRVEENRATRQSGEGQH